MGWFLFKFYPLLLQGPIVMQDDKHESELVVAAVPAIDGRTELDHRRHHETLVQTLLPVVE